jgi:hypothetical protein
MPQENLYAGIQDSFDSVGSGNTQGQLSRIERTVFAALNLTPPPFPNPYGQVDAAGRMALFGHADLNPRTGAVSDGTNGTYPWTGAKFGQLFEVNQPGEFVYLDRDLLSDIALQEVGIVFDDAPSESFVSIAPGTAVDRKFRKFRVVNFMIEDAAALVAQNGDPDPDGGDTISYAAIQVKFLIGTNLRVHSRPDLRVKISEIGDSVTFNGISVQGLSTVVSAVDPHAASLFGGQAIPNQTLPETTLQSWFVSADIGVGVPIRTVLLDGGPTEALRDGNAVPLNCSVQAEAILSVYDIPADAGAAADTALYSVTVFACDPDLSVTNGFPDAFGVFSSSFLVKYCGMHVQRNSQIAGLGAGDVVPLLENLRFHYPIGMKLYVTINSNGVGAGVHQFRAHLTAGIVGTPTANIDYTP